MATPPEDTLTHDAIRRLAELSSDRDDLIVSVVEPDECRILWCSEPGLRRIADREPTEIIGRSPSSVFPGEDEYGWIRTLQEATTGETIRLDREVERPDGRRIRLASTAWRVDRDGPVVALSVRHPDERRGRGRAD